MRKRRKIEKVQIMLTEEEKQSLKIEAKRNRMNMSEFVIHRCLPKLKFVSDISSRKEVKNK